MASPDPRVRALAVEVAGYRGDGAHYAADMIERLEDAEPAVRQRAHTALVRLAGRDVGQDPDAWRELGRQRGWLR